MNGLRRLEPIEAAKKFIDKHFSNCNGAILAGSVVRGEATKTSDLDIVVFDENQESSYRESMVEFDWAIEVFVHNLTSYKKYFQSDYDRGRPSLPRMVSEGVVLRGKENIELIRNEAKAILENGPEKWSLELIQTKRYFITDALDDFIGCNNRAEEIFIANTLAESVHEFVLRTNGQWIGASKWIIRALKHYDENFTEEFVDAFDTFYKTGKKYKVVEIVDKVLQPFGGRLFEGFSSGKRTK